MVLAPAEARLWVAVTGIVALVAFVAISLARRRSVIRLAADIDKVLHEGRRISFSNCREGDVAVLANELEKMVGRLARTSDQLSHERNALSEALADISHQIRTPLTAILLMMPLVERADDAQERRRYVRELERLVGQVSWLVTTLLKIAKVDAGAIHVERQTVLAADVVRRACAPLALAMDLRCVDMVMDVDEDATFLGDASWTVEAVENVVKNCMEHTPAGGVVTVTVREDALATSVIVSDTGPGISPEDLPHIFERFYRGRRETPQACEGDEAAARVQDDVDAPENAEGALEPCCLGEPCEDAAPQPSEGFGIGLALAQALVSAQGGTLRASNNASGGARFEIAFPKIVV